MCEVDFCDSDVSWCSETEHKARKTYRCACCRGFIEPGQVYVRHFYAYDGIPYRERMCAPCRDARKAFGDAHGFSWTTPSYFCELLKECIDERDEESMTRWQPMLDAMKARAESATGAAR